MTPITVLSTALLPLAAARALLPRQANFTTTDFGLIAIHSGSAIHLSSINAADSKFWIGKDTQTYCPEIEGLVCPTESYTAFAATSGYSTLGMNVIVPGGQQVYVTPSGALGFTPAHSTYSPTGSSFVGFNATVPSSPFTLGRLAYNGTESFLACPTEEGKGPYQVFVDIPGISDKDVPGCLDECIGFLAATVRSTNGSAPAAWQYV